MPGPGLLVRRPGADPAPGECRFRGARMRVWCLQPHGSRMAAGKIKYIICAAPRTGSNVLCDYLKHTHLAGNPAEYFNPDFIISAAKKNAFGAEEPLRTRKYIQGLVKGSGTKNGVVGIKLLYEHFVKFSHSLAFQELFMESKIIFLSRSSKIQQAVSFYFAQCTGQWLGSNTPRMRPEDVPFDFDKIKSHMNWLIQQEISWRLFFEAASVVPYNIVYEDFVLNPGRVVSDILATLGVDCREVPMKTTLAAQTHSNKNSFCNRYAEESRAQAFEIFDSFKYRSLSILQ